MRKTPRPSLFSRFVGSPSLLSFLSSVFPFKNCSFISSTGSRQVSLSIPRSIFQSLIISNTFCPFFSSVNTHHHFSTNSSKIPSFSERETERKKTHVDITPKSCIGIGKLVISRCSYIWEKKVKTFAKNSCLQDILKEYGDLSPETTCRFWRVSALEPGDFLEILLGFGPDVVNLRKVGFLWNLFRWASNQSRDFCHLPKSYEIMTAMLIRARMLGDAESLLLSVEARVAFSGDSWMFSEIIEGYAKDSQMENSIALYNQARDWGLVPWASCYRVLLDLLIRMEKADLAPRVYMDMIEVGFGSNSEDHVLEFVVRSLSKIGKILEAVNILRRVRSIGVEPSTIALTAIVEGYCRKKDYEDVLIFLKEWKHIPDTCVCNKIVSSLCRNLCTEEAWLFVRRMEDLGFALDAITFGILIAQSCRERKLRKAFIYLSESLSRSIKPKVHAYNALISGVFKEGMYSCAKDIFEEMVEKGLTPDLSTFKLLLAGYCKCRKFDEVKLFLGEMTNCGMISVAPMEDALTKAFMVLGLDHLDVKLKRDNDVGLAKAEFFDSLGNGLYLETDLEEYDKILQGILDNAMVPDFESLILKECRKGNIETALRVKDEAVQWGENLSLSTFSELLKGLTASPSHIKKVIVVLNEMPELRDQLDHKTLNLLIRNLWKNEITVSVRLILDRLFKRELLVESDTYSAMIMGFCKEKDINGLRDCLELTQRSTWLSWSKDIKALISFLCKSEMIKEVLELFDSMMERYSNRNLISAMCNAILKELCVTGFTNVGYILVEEILQRGVAVNNAAYTSLIEGFLKEQSFTEALGIIDELLDKNIIPSANIYQLIVPSLFRFGRAEKAMSLKQNMLSAQFKPAILVYSPLVNELCRIGKMKEATFQLQEILVNRGFPDNITLNALIRGYCHVNNLGKALEILCVMLRNHVELSISGYRSLVRQFCAHGQVCGALSLEALMQGESESLSLVLYNILIFSLFQSGSSLLVEALLKNMLENRLVPDRDTYNILIYGFSKCGNLSRSVELLNTMIIEGLKPSNRSLRTVICYLCSNGELNKALEVSKVMECSGWKHGSVVQYVLTEGLFSCGGISKAELFLDRMEEKNMIPNNINYDLLIKKFCVHGSIKYAVRLLNVMLKKGNFPSVISYSLVITGLSIRKEFDQALDFHAEMLHRNLEPSLDSCNALVRGLCDNGRTDDARYFMGEMLRFGPIPTRSMYNYVIDKYYAENKLDKASELLHEMQRAGYSPNFETHWSLISNLSNCNKDDDDGGKGFLSHLLSGNGLPAKNYEDKSLSTYK